MNCAFLNYISRPTLITPGHYFLIKSRFVLSDNLPMNFYWEIKCINKLPEISLSFLKITKGTGRYIANFSNQFIFPEKICLPAVKAAVNRSYATVYAQGTLMLARSENIPLGPFRLLIEMSYLEKKQIISQKFLLVKKNEMK